MFNKTLLRSFLFLATVFAILPSNIEGRAVVKHIAFLNNVQDYDSFESTKINHVWKKLQSLGIPDDVIEDAINLLIKHKKHVESKDNLNRLRRSNDEEHEVPVQDGSPEEHQEDHKDHQGEHEEKHESTGRRRRSDDDPPQMEEKKDCGCGHKVHETPAAEILHEGHEEGDHESGARRRRDATESTDDDPPQMEEKKACGCGHKVHETPAVEILHEGHEEGDHETGTRRRRDTDKSKESSEEEKKDEEHKKHDKHHKEKDDSKSEESQEDKSAEKKDKHHKDEDEHHSTERHRRSDDPTSSGEKKDAAHNEENEGAEHKDTENEHKEEEHKDHEEGDHSASRRRRSEGKTLYRQGRGILGTGSSSSEENSSEEGKKPKDDSKKEKVPSAVHYRRRRNFKVGQSNSLDLVNQIDAETKMMEGTVNSELEGTSTELLVRKLEKHQNPDYVQGCEGYQDSLALSDEVVFTVKEDEDSD